jgi:hypothetical protein
MRVNGVDYQIKKNIPYHLIEINKDEKNHISNCIHI